MWVLGIETSCDETAVAVVSDRKEIKSQKILSQFSDHQPYGGVVPEVAARAHLQHLPSLIKECMQEAQLSFQELSGIAVTGGPGLIGGVIVGVTMAKAIAAVHKLPFVAINHLLGHALTARLTHDLNFPYLLLLMSGGHCQLVIVQSPDSFKILGSTVDDAVGECFDKVAKMMGLPYPGGPSIERLASKGKEGTYSLPIPLLGHKNRPYSFSFSGLKSAVRRHLELNSPPQEKDKQNLAASLQATIAKSLVSRTTNALTFCQNNSIPITGLVLSGGVASNQYLRQSLEQLTTKYGVSFIAPPPHLCTDNGAMIAWAGIERLRRGEQDGLDFKPRPRWSLEELKGEE
jgi:N6-L-threonylcarbamoyladenine synthase